MKKTTVWSFIFFCTILSAAYAQEATLAVPVTKEVVRNIDVQELRILFKYDPVSKKYVPADVLVGTVEGVAGDTEFVVSDQRGLQISLLGDGGPPPVTTLPSEIRQAIQALKSHFIVQHAQKKGYALK